MKSLRVLENVVVDYFGFTVAIPYQISWLATDEGGYVYGYETEPAHDDMQFWYGSDDETGVPIAIATLGDTDWKDTKRRVQ
jgi:hypothetical protein